MSTTTALTVVVTFDQLGNQRAPQLQVETYDAKNLASLDDVAMADLIDEISLYVTTTAPDSPPVTVRIGRGRVAGHACHAKTGAVLTSFVLTTTEA